MTAPTLVPLAALLFHSGSYMVTPAHITGPAASSGYPAGILMPNFSFSTNTSRASGLDAART